MSDLQKPSIWEKQPLGLLLFTGLFIVFAAPGLITVLIVCNIRASHSAFFQIAVECVFAFAAVFSLVAMTGFVLRRPLSETGFQIRGVFMETMIGLLIGAALMSVAIGILTMTGHLVTIAHDNRYNWAPAAILCLLIAVAEESVYRGYMLTAFERRWGTATALIISSLLFGAMHILNVLHESPAVQLKVTSFIAVEAGLLLGAAYLTTKRLWLPIGIHWAWNFFLGPFYGAPVSGTQMMGSFSTSRLVGSALWTGGKFGPEAGIVVFFVCTTAALLLLTVVARSGKWQTAPA